MNTVNGRLRRLPLLTDFSPSAMRIAYVTLTGFLVFVYPWSLLFIVWGGLPADLAWTGSIVIILFGVTTLLSELRKGFNRRVVLEFVLLTAGLFGVEYLGQSTGVPFGHYTYTPVLGLTVAGVPVAISFAWYSSIVNARRLAGRLSLVHGWSRIWPTALIAGIIAVALDLVLEPMAAFVHGYWVWRDGSVPVQNYAAWFALTVLTVYLLERTQPKTEPLSGTVHHALLILGMQWGLFMATAVMHQHYGPALISTLLVIGLFMNRRGLPIRLLHNTTAPE